MRIAVEPPSAPSGIITVRLDDEAAARRAGCAPTRTCGTAGSTGKSSPWSVMRPPSIPHSGRTAVTRPRDEARVAPTSRLVVEFDIPVEVVAPRLGRLRQLDRDANRRRLVGTLGGANEMHASLL